MLLTDDSDNVYFMAYGPCSLKSGKAALTVDTLYPFRNSVTVRLESECTLTLNLKVPSFASGYSVKINGETVVADVRDGFIPINRSWKTGDTVTVDFEAKVTTVTLHDDDYSANHPMAIKYGALVYVYHIPERWSKTKGRPMTALPDGWSWYNVSPDFKEADVPDAHERLGLRREQISWNIALDERLEEKDFVIEELPPEGYAWESPMIKLHTHCYKAPHLFPPYPQTTYEPYGEYHEVREKLDLTLVPYGCTNLRITYFPKAKLD
jgi:hypothetical protein